VPNKRESRLKEVGDNVEEVMRHDLRRRGKSVLAGKGPGKKIIRKRVYLNRGTVRSKKERCRDPEAGSGMTRVGAGQLEKLFLVPLEKK